MKDFKKYLNQKNILIVVVMVGAVIGGFASVNKLFVDDSSVATLVLAFGDSNRQFEGEVVDGMTILDSMIVSSEAGDIGFRYFISEDNNVYIMEFDGYVHLPGVREISFQLNSEKINAKDINKTLIHAGDEITVSIEGIE